VLTFEQIKQQESEAKSLKKKDLHGCIQLSRECSQAYLGLPRPNFKKAADCLHRIATCYHTLAAREEQRALLRQYFDYERQALNAITEAIGYSPENNAHRSYRQDISNKLLNRVKSVKNSDIDFLISLLIDVKSLLRERNDSLEDKNLLVDVLVRLHFAYKEKHQQFPNNSEEIVDYALGIAQADGCLHEAETLCHQLGDPQKSEHLRSIRESFVRFYCIGSRDEDGAKLKLYSNWFERDRHYNNYIIVEDIRLQILRHSKGYSKECGHLCHSISSAFLKSKDNETLDADELYGVVCQAVYYALDACNFDETSEPHKTQYALALQCYADIQVNDLAQHREGASSIQTGKHRFFKPKPQQTEPSCKNKDGGPTIAKGSSLTSET